MWQTEKGWHSYVLLGTVHHPYMWSDTLSWKNLLLTPFLAKLTAKYKKSAQWRLSCTLISSDTRKVTQYYCVLKLSILCIFFINYVFNTPTKCTYNRINVLIITFSHKYSGTAAATSTNNNILKTILKCFAQGLLISEAPRWNKHGFLSNCKELQTHVITKCNNILSIQKSSPWRWCNKRQNKQEKSDN